MAATLNVARSCELFASMLDAGLVDSVEVGIIPVLLGGGIPFLKPPVRCAKLELRDHKLYRRRAL